MRNTRPISRQDVIGSLEASGAVDQLRNMKAYASLQFLSKRGSPRVRQRALRALEGSMDALVASNDLKSISSISKRGRLPFALQALDYLYAEKRYDLLAEAAIRCCYFTDRPKIGFRALTLLDNMTEYLIRSRNASALSFIAMFSKKKKQAFQKTGNSNRRKETSKFNMQTYYGRLAFMSHFFASAISDAIPNMALNNSNAIVGLEENALPLVKRVANELHLKPALMRNSDSAGKNWRLDTTTLSGNPKSIVLIDDTITTGKALKAVVSALNGSKYHVCGIVVLVNFGKVKRIGGLPVHSIL